MMMTLFRGVRQPGWPVGTDLEAPPPPPPKELARACSRIPFVKRNLERGPAAQAPTGQQEGLSVAVVSVGAGAGALLQMMALLMVMPATALMMTPTMMMMMAVAMMTMAMMMRWQAERRGSQK